MTESLMLALTARGMARADAHELLRTITRDPLSPPPIQERVRANAAVRTYLEPGEIDEIVRPSRYSEAAAAKTDRIVARLEREFGASTTTR